MATGRLLRLYNRTASTPEEWKLLIAFGEDLAAEFRAAGDIEAANAIDQLNEARRKGVLKPPIPYFTGELAVVDAMASVAGVSSVAPPQAEPEPAPATEPILPPPNTPEQPSSLPMPNPSVPEHLDPLPDPHPEPAPEPSKPLPPLPEPAAVRASEVTQVPVAKTALKPKGTKKT